jgi:hypothetical protein
VAVLHDDLEELMKRTARTGSGLFVPAYSLPLAEESSTAIDSRGGSASSERREAVTSWSALAQAIVSFLTLAVTTVAAAFAYFAYKEQHSINESQRAINDSQAVINNIDKERFARRYASRVAVWRDGDVDRIFLQNRSPAPLTNVFMISTLEIDSDTADISQVGGPAPRGVDKWYQRRIYRFKDIPPCTVVQLESVFDDTGSSGRTEDFDPDQLHFHDGIDSWTRTWDGALNRSHLTYEYFDISDGLYILEGKPQEALSVAEQVPAKPREVSPFIADVLYQRVGWRARQTSAADCGEGQ